MGFHCLDQGQGPAIVFLHGFCESPAIFDGLLPYCPAGTRIIRPVLPGHQSTPWTPSISSIDAAADWLRDLLDHLHIRNCTLVGHSLGGYIAAAMAARHPQYLDRIVMLHATAQADLPERQAQRTRAITFIERHGPAPFLKAFVQALFNEPKAAWTAELTEITNTTLVEAIQGYSAAMRDRPDRLAALQASGIPTLYLVGEEDGLVRPERNQIEFAEWEAVEVLRLAGVGHMGMYEATEEVAEAIIRFARLGRA